MRRQRLGLESVPELGEEGTVVAVCLRNKGYPASLELRKTYRVLADVDGAAHGLIQVVDESGVAYLYPQKFFLPIEFLQPLRPQFVGRRDDVSSPEAALTRAWSGRP